jgi:predicted DNA-binding protein (UPF0251 family)
MSRHKNLRKIATVPLMKGFRPFGLQTDSSSLEPIFLHIEEYEAFKLCDYDQLNHIQACELMQVSRPTFTRIYAAARAKIATAFAEGRNLLIEGGKVFFDSEWFFCEDCNCHFNNPEYPTAAEICPLCGGSHFISFDIEKEKQRQESKHYRCRCHSCGNFHLHDRIGNCSIIECPDCKTIMNQFEQVESI